MSKKIIISGGGTGGHIFPAISIANALKKIDSSIEILFVGAIGRIEMDKVPKAGYKIIGLSIEGFERKLSLKNVIVIFKFIKSFFKSLKIIKSYKPDAVVGVGGYASSAILYAANFKKIPTLIQEQNSYAGLTNKLLAQKVHKICVAYDGMEKFFSEDKIILTGNPVRSDILNKIDKSEALKYFGFTNSHKTILVIGGSLGARTINQSVLKKINKIKESNINLIWQVGKYYYNDISEKLKNTNLDNILVKDFVIRMDYAFASADLVISRAGAGTISELCLVKKAVILVPSPNVAEDHQTKNAMNLVKNNAAILVNDSEAKELLVDKALELINNEDKIKELSENIASMAFHNSADIIAKEVLSL